MEFHDSPQRKPQVNRGIKQKNDSKASVHTANTILDQEQKRRTVFKAVLDSPFTIKWPEVSLSNQRFILEELCRTLLVVDDYRRQASKIRRDYRRQMRKNKRDKLEINTENRDSAHDPVRENVVSIELTSKPKSVARQFGLVIGINDVTKHIEQSYDQKVASNFQQRCIQPSSKTIIPTNSSVLRKSDSNSSELGEPLRMIFVCKADISPQHLIAHLPIMASIANVLIVPLPSGSSREIAGHIGISKVAALGIKKISPEFDKLYELIRDMVKPVCAPWLMPLKTPEISKKRKCPDEEQEETIAGPSSFSIKEEGSEESAEQKTHTNYHPTQIKQLKTTAPINKEKSKKKSK